MRIAVVALGKIGLPLAVQFASSGHEVIGVDVNQRTVDKINSGLEPFPGEAHLQEKLAEVIALGRFRATTEFAEAIPEAEAVVLVAPVFVDEETWEPDFQYMDAATIALAAHLSEGTLISYETTLPVGATRTRFASMLEKGSGLTEGVDFHVVYSPERVLTGRVFEDLRKYPKLIGALSEEGNRRAREFYEAVLQFDERPDLPRPNGVWDLGTTEASEMAKLAETTYRDVNIGLANQFGLFAASHGIDVYKVIEACNSQPYSHIHRPGIAVGGHCIPVYPRLYLATDPEADIVRTARQLNASMPDRLVSRAESVLGSLTGLTAVVLGAAYRGGVKETALSGVFPTVQALRERGADVRVHDPLYTDEELRALGFVPHTLGDTVDVAVLQTDHAIYRTFDPSHLPGIRLLVDGRAATDPALWAGTPRIVVGAA
ncbi:nucleotide sugar dehydrogenase [Microbacterium azadirachtae]|uniref:UDP-N-acetyl-D-glucosamine 6-dehydrogenase n=1 Tax=Microbacterium azadirachtae TaxID=582680 RepID=A0A0F0KZL4_9MICO|nr:nucleotide sugar dehydrogenase [Microbacterium azadirachtae]KJL26332.1 UDP-N-acetyl-D-glucosamine 6-dehydrogenase [Microbacterium azadirachtae]UXW85241.1 nucleotide sugar dehydrogenase [Microbacterium azadirachtae]SDM42954.1 nucleotide sugar dehydrogenase [Microbacterium azadirachtae]SEG57387.1 nucleotide sugar dehydrogenase [Microbacterium azadirachtae]SEG60331.1 nucleotide sugar dehydrogenase [Microbacterium azadirachtae]